MNEEELELQRRRIVHHLVRSFIVRAEDGAFEHLSLDEIAAFLGGSLFESESARIENHLLSCRQCRDVVRALHEEHEAGVMPLFLRRTTEVRIMSSVSRNIGRRWWPWMLAAIVFIAVAVVPVSVQKLFSAGRVEFPDARWVISRSGTPVIEMPQGRRRHAAAGHWIETDQSIFLEAGDAVTLADATGRVVRVVRRQRKEEVVAESPLVAKLFNSAREMRTSLLAESRVPSDAGDGPLQATVLYPRGLIRDREPAIRWRVPGDPRKCTVKVIDVAVGDELISIESTRTRASFPVAAPRLIPERKYRVDVKPQSGEFGGEAAFELVSDERAAAMTRDLAELARIAGSRANVLGVEALRSAGLLADAMLELETLRDDDRFNVEIQRLLLYVYGQMGLVREAAEARKALEKY